VIRKAYLKRVEAKLEDWEEELSRLGAKAEKAEASARVIYVEQMALVRSRQKAALARIRDLRDARADNWGKFKSGVDESMSDLKKTIEEAIEKLRKIA
jgi:hypothetical protein